MAEKKKKAVSSKTSAPKKKKVVKKVEVSEQEVPQVEASVAYPRRPKEKKLAVVRYCGTGRRKEAVARVFVQPGTGQITVNGRELGEYFCKRKLLEFRVKRPLVVTNTLAGYDVVADVYGGGVPGQADALSLGIARALLKLSPDLRLKLKRVGLLRRDPRMKERKKYGLKRARRAFQYSKR